MARGGKKPNYYHIGSLENGINILKALAGGGTMSLAEIAAETKMDRSGCHRYVLTFRDLGLLTKETAGYRLTPMLFEISMMYVNRLEVRQVVRPFMEELSLKYGETVNLAMRDGDHLIFLEKIQSTRNYRAEISTGTRHPLYCTALGKAILAFQPEAEREAYYARNRTFTPHTEKTVHSLDTLRQDLASIRERGFSLDDEEYFQGLRCVATPIIKGAGGANFSFGVAGPTSRMSMEVLMEIGRELKEMSGKIASRM